jgi:hypothetical protein
MVFEEADQMFSAFSDMITLEQPIFMLQKTFIHNKKVYLNYNHPLSASLDVERQ